MIIRHQSCRSESGREDLKFIDNGLGMTAEEVEEYITQIAFSGATEFLENIKTRQQKTI